MEPAAIQDLVDDLPKIIKAAAGIPLRFRLNVSLGDGHEIGAEKIETINKLLEKISPDLRLKP